MTLEIKRDTKRHKHAAYMRFFRLSEKKSMLESHKIITIHATQKSTFQAVPNVQFNYKSQEEEKEYATKSPREQLKLVTEASQKCANGNNKKQRPRGYYFNGHGIGDNVYIINDNHDIIICNEKKYGRGSGKHISISVRYLNNNNKIVQDFVTAAHNVGKTWVNEGNQTIRSVISGAMKHFGTVPGAGDCPEFRFAPTMHNKNGVNFFHKNANISAKLIAQRHFPKAFKDIQRVMKFHCAKISSELGGDKGLCCEMVQSQHALVTEPHVDMDQSKCLSIWTVEKGKEVDTTGWYFVLPYLTCNVEGRVFSGIAVKLRHCTGIEWDGRCVSHCSTSPNDPSINVYGTFFGITSHK
jgi:hypothetical protein